MKNKIFALVVAVSLSVLAFTAFGGTMNAWSYIAKAFTGGSATLLNTDTQGALLTSQGNSAINAISGVPVVVKASAGRIVKVSVISASGVGAIYNAATTGAANASNQIGVIPASVGVTSFDFPASAGIVVNPASSVVSVSYQ